MTALPAVAQSATPPLDDAHQKLKKAAQALEGMFFRQLLSAMRATVPSGPGNGGPGGEMFTGMMDDTIADRAAEHMQRGIGNALYRQLSAKLDSTT